MKVIFHYDCGDWLERRLGELGEVGLDVAICPEADEERFRFLLTDAEVLWHALKPVTAAHVAAAPRLRLIQKIGVGVNTIDLEAAKARGIAVCNMPGTNSRAVAEMTLALMLAAVRRLTWFDGLTRRGEGWGWPVAAQGSLGEIAGRTVGLVGYGGVPALLAPVLTAMGARVLYTARAPKPDVPAGWRDKAGLLAESDIVSLHIPETAETRGWLDRAAIAAMKPGAVLVNTARGGLVDEPALVDALRSGHLSAAGLDVFAAEPATSSPLFDLDNVVLAPHVAWFTTGTLERSIAVAVENCRRIAAGDPLLHRVA